MATAGSNRSMPSRRVVAATSLHMAAQTGRIAIVSPHRKFTGRAAGHLHDAAFDVATVFFSRSLLDDLAALLPDVVVVEHDASSGTDLVRMCRDVSQSVHARIVVIAGDGGEADETMQVDALDAGADDFVPNSVSARVFAARIRAALRGRAAMVPRPTSLSVGDMTLDLEAHALSIAGVETKCPPLQFALLVALAHMPNRVISRTDLAAIAWGSLPDPSHSRRLRVAISALRAVLGAGPDRPRVESIAGVGYRLVPAAPDGNVA